MMQKNIITRLVITKVGGLIFGALFLLTLYCLGITIDIYLMLGILMWTAMIGVLTGLFGFMTIHPYFGFKMNPWFRGAISGLIVTLLIVLMGWPTLVEMMDTFPLVNSPWWLLIDGVIIGVILDIVGTKYGNEGQLLHQ